MNYLIREITIDRQSYTFRVKEPKEENYSVSMEVFAILGECVWEKGVTYDPPKKSYERRDAT